MVALSGSGWKLAPALVTLMREVDGKWPNRSKASDGSIGDTAHSERTSDHNPRGGYVRAVDITTSGIDRPTLIAAAIADPRTKYIISQGRIWKNPLLYKNGGWQKYTGSNPHDKHTHISVSDAGTLGTATWFPAPTPATPNVEGLAKMATLIIQTGGAGDAGKGADWGEVTFCAPETGVFLHLNQTQVDSMKQAGYPGPYQVNQAAYDQLRLIARLVAGDKSTKGKTITG